MPSSPHDGSPAARAPTAEVHVLQGSGIKTLQCRSENVLLPEDTAAMMSWPRFIPSRSICAPGRCRFLEGLATHSRVTAPLLLSTASDSLEELVLERGQGGTRSSNGGSLSATCLTLRRYNGIPFAPWKMIRSCSASYTIHHGSPSSVWPPSSSRLGPSMHAARIRSSSQCSWWPQAPQVPASM